MVDRGPDAAQPDYPYFEDINEGVLRQLPERTAVMPLARVLDVGCGSGMLGAAIKSKGYEVWGMERDPTALSKAVTRLDRVFDGDVSDATQAKASIGDVTFDVLVFSDILEHLVDPVGVLRSYTPMLAPGGRLVVSVPNVANWQTRLGLAFGRFNYQDVGVLDRTHLKFFTKTTARHLVEDAGFEVVAMDFTPLIARAATPLLKRALRKRSRSHDPTSNIISSPLFEQYMRHVYPLEYAVCRVVPGLLSFRIIVVARAR